jgi:hypothetical protein
MFQFLLNPWMLAGLVGIALPVMAHLLSRRRFDVVEWGAMQFLNPSRKTRRRLKLEELLLLLLRITLISLIVFAATRPVVPSGWFSGYSSAGSRTVVIVIDGSNSMSRSDGVNSVHQNAVRRSLEFLQTLGPDDNVALIDARDQPRSVIESPIRDLQVVEEQIKTLPPPGGSCAMLSAIEKAVGILGRSSSSAREIVVFADRQAQGWQTTREAEWLRVDEMLKFPAVRPQIWVVDVAPHLGPIGRNVSVGRIEMSREMSVPDFPVRLRVPVRNDSDQEIQVPVRLLLDGQALAGEQQTPTIAARSETMLEFDHSIRPHGTHVLSVEAESKDDAIAVDNVSHAAVHVADSLSVLLVNGTSAAAAADRDTFFAELAFAPPEGKAPWVNARVIDAVDLQPSDFESMAVAIFCNVDQISPAAAIALAEFVAKGNGAIIACGPNTTPEKFRQSFGDSDLLPQLEIVRTREAPPQAEEQVHVAPLSIQPGWLERFRSDPARSFLKATFSAWCLTKLNIAKMGDGFVAAPGNQLNAKSPPKQPAPADPSANATPIVLAQLSTGDPLILQSRHQDGIVLVVTTTLNRQWNDLPTRSDFVPFLHEAVFHVASARSHRNVSFAEPLVVRVPAAKPAPDAPEKADTASTEATIVFTAPDGSEAPVTARPETQALVAVQGNTFAPGVYRSTFANDNAEPVRDAYVVNYDHAEDNLAQLTADDKARLATNDRVRFSSSLDDLTKRMYGDESVTELWAILMTAFLLFLITELLLTRRAIRKGYGGESLATA